ncbi:MAG: N utilization substance protein B [Glaciecola sp.]|jgi:N utilization substance protein B
MIEQPLPRRPDTSDPSRSRHRALKVLFSADLRREDARIVMDGILVDPEAMALLDEVDLDDLDLIAQDRTAASALLARPGASRRMDGYAQRLVVGVAEHLDELDEHIRTHAKGWRLERMPLVDRNLLRMSIYEMLHEGVKAAIVIDEAVEMAKELSSDEAPRFVNGVLEAVRREQAAATA